MPLLQCQHEVSARVHRLLATSYVAETVMRVTGFVRPFLSAGDPG